jgi:hypothetical protein
MQSTGYNLKPARNVFWTAIILAAFLGADLGREMLRYRTLMFVLDQERRSAGMLHDASAQAQIETEIYDTSSHVREARLTMGARGMMLLLCFGVIRNAVILKKLKSEDHR